jgi:hypothetical protein
MTTCREVRSWIETFADGELPLEHAVDTECHVAQCHCCAERLRFERSFRSSVKQAVQTDSQASESFEKRMQRVLLAERATSRVFACTQTSSTYSACNAQQHIQPIRRQVDFLGKTRKLNHQRPTATDTLSSTWGALRWRTLLPLAAVAAGAIVWAGAQNQRQSPSDWNSASASDLRLSELDSYLDVMVNRHRSPRPQAQSIQFSHEDLLDPPFQLPPFQDVRSLEARPSAVRIPATNVWLSALRGASSAYQIRGHRVTFFAYEAATAPLRARLEGHPLRGHIVYVGRRQGYSVATVEEGPVGYAMTSDLPPLEGAELIASAIDARVRH